MQTPITILGSGGMATACAVLLCEHAGQTVTLWARSAERAEELARDRENRRLLPGVLIPPSVEVTHQIASAAAESELFVAAIPTKYLRETLGAIAADVPPGIPVVSVAKGLEIGTLMRPSEIIIDVLGPRDVVALCGPSHAEEIARRMPASVVAACTNLACAERVQTLFSTDRFRVYTNADILGVELAGAIKNVIAIAAGICDGLGFGDNAKSTRHPWVGRNDTVRHVARSAGRNVQRPGRHRRPDDHLLFSPQPQPPCRRMPGPRATARTNHG